MSSTALASASSNRRCASISPRSHNRCNSGWTRLMTRAMGYGMSESSLCIGSRCLSKLTELTRHCAGGVTSPAQHP